MLKADELREILKNEYGITSDDELEIAIAKESSNKKRDELIKLHNGYMSEYDSLKKQIIWLAVLGICFLVVLVILGYFIWNSYNSENMSYTSSWLQERV